MKKSLFEIVLFVALLISVVARVPAAQALELGGLNIVFDKSDSTVTDVEMALRIGGKEALGVGACSPYAWRVQVNDVKFADVLSICSLISGDISEDDAKARISVGVSLINLSGLRTFIGFDPIHGGSSRGIGASASGVHDFFGK